VPRPCAPLAEALSRRSRAIEQTRARVEALTISHHLSSRAAEHVYEGLFLNTVTAFESFVETLFIGLLVSSDNRLHSKHDVQPRMLIGSHAVAREIVLAPRQKYVDWLPYDKTLSQAERCFRGGRPFSLVTAPQAQTLDRIVKIRNAIAHKSRHSLSTFETVVIGTTPLPPRETTPAGFLRGLLMAAPARTRFEDYVSSLVAIARLLAK
jgi:hypothetical protein